MPESSPSNAPRRRIRVYERLRGPADGSSTRRLGAGVVLIILIVIMAAFVLYSLVRGVIVMAQGADTTVQQAQNCMRKRVKYQSIAIVLVDRLRDDLVRRGFGTRGYNQEQVLDDVEYEDEIPLDVLEQTLLAGTRFKWMINRLQGN